MDHFLLSATFDKYSLVAGSVRKEINSVFFIFITCIHGISSALQFLDIHGILHISRKKGDSMTKEQIWDIYLTMQGQLIDSPWKEDIQNLYEPGKVCDLLSLTGIIRTSFWTA